MTCLSIITIVGFCTLNVATTSTGIFLITSHYNTRHTSDHIPMAKDSASNGAQNWNYVTNGILTSFTAPNGTVYIGSGDNNLYALNATTGTKLWNYTTGGAVRSSSAVI